MRLATVCAMVLMLAPGPASACRLALLLAIDVSRSIDAGDYRIQRDGLLDALADPAVRAALFGLLIRWHLRSLNGAVPAITRSSWTGA